MALQEFYIIGQDNHASWSNGYNAEEFLKVLPHPDIKVPYTSAWLEWQKGQADYKNGNYTYEDPNGLYYSSWGPESDVVEIELDISAFNELYIPGLGNLIAKNTNNDSSYDDNFLFYNGTAGSSQGPLIVVDPGDTIKIKLTNNAPEDPASSYFDDTNLHTHGLHVSAQGNSDNVLITIDSGTSWETEIKVPDDHFVGPDWYHPHLHGATNIQVSKGMAGALLIQPSEEETSDLDKFNPVTDPVYWMSLQTWGLNQEERLASSTDPVNQDPDGNAFRVATPPEFSSDGRGERTYNVSEAGYIGYNYMPTGYDPTLVDSGGAYYGFGLNGTPIENIIHTVNGQYNPTIDAKVGEWNLFGFLNFAVNSHHVIQLVREHEGELSLEEFQLVAVDGDVSGAAEDGLASISETPAIAPGARMTVQHAFTKPGKYYFLSNGTNEILGDLAPKITNTDSKSSVTGDTYGGFNDGHLVWGPQVLATVDVTGDAISEQPGAPEPWDYIAKEQVEIDAWMKATDAGLEAGEIKQRTFVWSAMSPDYPKFGEDNLAGEPVGKWPPGDNDPADFEGAYRINGRYFGHTPQDQTVVAMAMLGTTEEWTIENQSYGDEGIWGEWHPFHIHQNDFIVTEINGLTTDEITSYPSNQLADTVVLGGAYIKGTETADNPYGQAAGINTENAQAFSTTIRMRFEDFPGAYVNHCHILFHEDAGMMQAVKVILNTDSTFLSTDQAEESVTLRLGSATDQPFQLQPYKRQQDNENVNVAIGDINYGKFFNTNQLKKDAYFKSGTKGYSDNITDVVTIQERREASENFKIRVFDGDALRQAATGLYKFGGFAPIASSNMSNEVISEEGNLKQLTLNGDIYLEKASSDPDDHSGTGGTGTWNLSKMEGTTYINDVFNQDGSYAGWNASTDPSAITGTNGEKIPSSYPEGSFVFSSSDGLDSLIASELHDVDEVFDGQGFEHYYIKSGTGRFEGASGGEIFGSENYYGGADINLYSDPDSLIQAKAQEIIDGTDTEYRLADITPFKGINHDISSETSLAVGDIDGDGHADIIAGIGSKKLQPIIEIYSGADYSLMGRISPFEDESTSINLAAGDINSDNFVDIIVGQGEGGTGRVEAFSGRLIFDVIQNSNGGNNGDASVQNINPQDGVALSAATELFTDVFRPFESDDYTGAVDVSSGYILPRPEDLQPADNLNQVIQSSFANLIALKVNSDSSKNSPSIKTFYYTGGSGHESHSGHGGHTEHGVHGGQTMFATQAEAEAAAANFGCSGAHQMGDMWMVCDNMSDMEEPSTENADIPTLESSLNINKNISSINGSFLDLSSNVYDRGYGALITQLADGREYAYYIETHAMQSGEQNVFKHQKISLTPGENIEGSADNEKITGTFGNDSITGRNGDDTLKGTQGDDHLDGNQGDDFLRGGKDNDILNGGKGNNTLHGGHGRDTFMIGKGTDLIKDFNIKRDMIEVPDSNYSIIADGNNSQILISTTGSGSDNVATIIGISATTLEDNISNVIQISEA